MASPLAATREQIIGFRRRAGALDVRLAAGSRSLRTAAWAGLQDSMPRAAVLSIHARVKGARPTSWEDRSLVQLWGPRFQVYVVSARDLAVFSLGRLPDDARGRARAEQAAAALHAHLAGARVPYGVAGEGLGVNANSLRYGAATGTVLIRWEGARAPLVWTVPAPDVDPAEARLELARRHLHVFGPSTAAAFAKWAGISARAGAAAFESLRPSLTAVTTPVGDGWMLSADERELRAEPGPAAPARLLPSGDSFFLLWDEQRALLVEDPENRGRLWTSRVWPGALLVDGEVRGTWRRAHDVVTIETWGALTRAQRDAVEAEAGGLPLPALDRGIRIVWDS